jgi:hypothetical protein
VKFLLLFIFVTFLYSDEFYYEFGKKVFLKPALSKMSRGVTKSDIRYYKTKNGKTIGIGQEILVKFKDGVDTKSFFNKYGIKNYKKLYRNVFKIKLDKGQDIFEFSQKLYHDKDTIYAIPNKIKKYQKR